MKRTLLLITTALALAAMAPTLAGAQANIGSAGGGGGGGAASGGSGGGGSGGGAAGGGGGGAAAGGGAVGGGFAAGGPRGGAPTRQWALRRAARWVRRQQGVVDRPQ